jgi:acyl carrier protein
VNQKEFLSRLADAIDYEGVIEVNQDIESIIEWDSLGILSVIELLSDLGVKVNPDALQKVGNISELLEIVEHLIHE